jgi:hypothetical protein
MAKRTKMRCKEIKGPPYNLGADRRGFQRTPPPAARTDERAATGSGLPQIEEWVAGLKDGARIAASSPARAAEPPSPPTRKAPLGPTSTPRKSPGAAASPSARVSMRPSPTPRRKGSSVPAGRPQRASADSAERPYPLEAPQPGY